MILFVKINKEASKLLSKHFIPHFNINNTVINNNNFNNISRYYITFLFYNTKISDNNAESGKVPRMLAAFPG
jgi:hypothetical protein